MTETRTARRERRIEERGHRDDRPVIALVVLLTLASLVLLSPIGWNYLLPAIGDSVTAVWTFLTTAWTTVLDGAMTAVDGMTGILAG